MTSGEIGGQIRNDDRTAHESEHDALVARVLDWRDRFSRGRTMTSVEISDVLREWMIQHIRSSDKRYGPFLNQRGVR